MIFRFSIPNWFGSLFIPKRDRDNVRELAEAHGKAGRTFGWPMLGLEYTVERIDDATDDQPAP